MAEAVESGASGSTENGCPAPPTPKSSSNRSVPLLATPNRPPLEVDTRLPPGWRRKLSKRLLGSSAGTYDVYIFSPDGRRFRSCVEVQKYVAEKDLESELDCYIFDFSTFGTNNLTLRARREAQATPKKSVKKKPTVSKVVAHKLIKQKAIVGKKKAVAVKKKAILKKAPVKTFAQKLVVKMDFLTRKRSANKDEDSESESSDADEEEAATEATAGKKTVSSKKRKVDAKSNPVPKMTGVDKAGSPHKTPKKGTGSSSNEDTSVVNGTAKGDDIENTQTEEAMDSAVHGGGDHNEQNNNDEPEQEAASPRKRSSSKTRKDSSTPLKEVNNAADRHPNTPLYPSGRRGRRSSSKDSLTAQSPRRKSASVYTDDEVSFHTPNKQKRSRLSKDSDRSGDEDSLMESPVDLSHGQVDGAAADTPPRRGRGRPRKDASEPETPLKVGRGRSRKFPLNSPKQVSEAMETESPAKELTRSRSGVDKEQTGEGSAARGDNVSPTKRTRGRPKSPIQPVESDPESVNPQENAEPVVKKKRGRPRKSLPGSVKDINEGPNEVNLEQSELVKNSTEGNREEIGEESPVKRGRGRPRKFPRTPGQATPKVSAIGSSLKTPAQMVQKRSLRESNKEEENLGESSTKKTPVVASKAKVSDEPDDSITESPVRRSRGRPRKIPVIEYAETFSRARPQREVVESREESNVIVTTAEIHREQSDDDDELPTLTYEGEQDSPPRETNLHKEPPLLVPSSNITVYEDDSIEPDPELPVLVSMSPRKSSRKPKPYFHKDFVSPTRKLISSYEQGRASSKKPKKDVKAVATPKRGRPRKVSEPAPEQEQSVKTPKRVAKLNEHYLERVASESDQAARRDTRTENGDTSDSREESVEEANEMCVNKVKTVVLPTGSNLGRSKLQGGDGIEEKVKGIQSMSASVLKKSAVCATESSVAGFGGNAVKGKTTHKVEAMEDVSNVGVESVKEPMLTDAEEPPALMPVDSVSTVEEPVPDTFVRVMDPADRAVLCAVLLDHAYTNSLTYSLPPEIVEEAAPAVLEQTEAAALEDVIEADSQGASVVDETETSSRHDTVASTPFVEVPPKEQDTGKAITSMVDKPKIIAAVSSVTDKADTVVATMPATEKPEAPATASPVAQTLSVLPVVAGIALVAEKPRVVTTIVPVPEEPKVATTIVPEVEEPKVAITSVPVAEEPKVATATEPVDEELKVATTSVPVTEEPKVATSSVQVAEEPKVATSSVRVAEEPKVATATEPVAEEPKVATSSVPVAEEPKVATSSGPVAEEPKVATTSVPVAEEPKVATSSVPVAEEPKVATSSVQVAEEPKVATATEPVAEEPKVATSNVPVAEEPKVATSSGPVAEEPNVATSSVPVAEEPKVATSSVRVAEEPQVATTIVRVAEKTTSASADSPLFERFKLITPASPVVEKSKPVVANSPVAKNLKAIVANSAVAGRLKAMTAMTVDKLKVVTATVAVDDKPKAVDVVTVEQSQVKEKTVTESKPLTKVKVTAQGGTQTNVKAGGKRKANADALPTPVKHAKLQDKPIPGPSVGLVSKAVGVKSVILKTKKQGKVSEKISPAKLGLSPGTLPRDMTTGVAGLVKPMGIKGTVIVRKNPKIVTVKKGLTSPKNIETSLVKLEKSLKGIKSQEKIVRVTPKKIIASHKGGEKMSPIKSKKGKLNLKDSERAALLKRKKGVKILKGEVQQHKKGLHGSRVAEKAGHIKAKKHTLHAKHGEMVPIGLHKKGAKIGKNISPDKHKKGHVGFKDGVKTSPEMIKKGLHRLKDGHKPTPDKVKKSIHGLKDGDKHKKAIASHRDSDRTITVKKSTHGLKDSERKTPDKPKKVTLSLKDSDKSPSEKPLKRILSVKDTDKPSADKPLKGILTVKESEKTPSDKPLKGILSVKSSGQLKPKKPSLTINTGEPESSATRSSESDQTRPSDSTEPTDKTPEKSCLTSKNDQTETKSPNGTRRVSIGAVEINEIDQTKSPGPPSTSFDLASLAFAPPTPKLNKRRKSSDSKSPKVKKVGGTWSFTPLSKMPPVSPKTPTPETPASPGTGPKETSTSSGTGPKSILKKS